MNTESIARSEEELITKVETAAKEGARQGASEIAAKQKGTNPILILFSFFQILIPIITLLGLIYIGMSLHGVSNNLDQFFTREEPVENHDLTLDNHGIIGYTVVDFQDAILGNSQQLKKLEVYSTEVSDLATITETGLGNLRIFTKHQFITYHGTATYTVDLRNLSKDDITLDEETQTLTVKIPHAQLEPINIPSDTIEFGEVKKGILAFGKINVAPEQMSEVQTAAKNKMEERLKTENVIEEADRFAKLSVWEIYQPVVAGVAAGYSLSVEFAE